MIHHPNEISKVLAVVVLYNEHPHASNTLLSLGRSLEKAGEKLDVLVYDNSPQAQHAESFGSLNITYIHDASNPGVSKAYNAGAMLAKQKDKSWLLLLDQDTTFPEDAVGKYLGGIHMHRDEVLMVPFLQSPNGIYSPSKYYFRKGFLWKDPQPGIYKLTNKMVLNSGMMVRLDAFLQTGGYRESVRLYFSDFYFVNKLRHVRNSFVVLDMTCFHELSDIARTDIHTSLRRFHNYCEGAIYSADSFADWFWLFGTILLRALLLAWRYKNIRFISVFFRNFTRRV